MRRALFLVVWMVVAAAALPARAQEQVRLILPAATAAPGTNVELPISVSDLGDVRVLAYEFTLRYDPAILEIDGGRLEGTMSAGGMQIANTKEPGVFKFAYASGMPIGGDGPLVILKATALKAGDTLLEVESLLFNEGEPKAEGVEGSVRVRAGDASESLP